MSIPDDLGKDSQTVAALQRRLANFEHDLVNLGTQVINAELYFDYTFPLLKYNSSVM